jgi:hypothetical protein
MTAHPKPAPGFVLCACALGCAASTVAPARAPLDIDPDPAMERAVLAASEVVDRDFPPDYGTDPDALEALAFQCAVTGVPLPVLDPESAARAACARERVFAELRAGRVLSVAFETPCGDHAAFHEVTAGLDERPLARFLARFDPASDWGRNLSGWAGGELAVDSRDANGHARTQRERMLLSPPWYAVGAPVMDMSKHEVVRRSGDSIEVRWLVVRSANDSVLLDTGSVRFEAWAPGGASSTLVVFNSVHELDPGWLGRSLPRALGSTLTQIGLRDSFSAHVRNYRSVAR